MSKDDLRYVGHMLDCAHQIEKFLAGKARAQYDADEVLRLAVIHLIQTMGEAARLVSDDFRDGFSNNRTLVLTCQQNSSSILMQCPLTKTPPPFLGPS